jgi:hypothetical protein
MLPFPYNIGASNGIDVITNTITWNAGDSPVFLSNSIEIAPDTRLRIESGVEVRLDAEVGIQVKGELIVQGSKDEPVIFTSNISDPIFPDYWADIRLHADSVGREHQVRWAIFRGADSALVVSSASVLVEDSVFDTCRYGILSRADARVDVTRTTFHNNSALGLEWQTGADGIARDCVFTDNVVGVYCFKNVTPRIVDCTFTGNYHHLSFAEGANATVVRSTLSNATAEHFECYWSSAPLFEDVTIEEDEDARVFLRNDCRPRFLGGTSVTKLRVDTTDGQSYAVALTRIIIDVVDDRGRRLEGANVTLRGASGDILTNGTTRAQGRLTGGLMSLFTMDGSGAGDKENPHEVVVEWKGHSQTFIIDPTDLTTDRILELEMAISPPQPDSLDLIWWIAIVAVLIGASVGLAFIARQRGRS